MDIPEGENYAAWKIPAHTQIAFEALHPMDKLRYVAACGHLAPSTHNTQPWRFLLIPESMQIEVYLHRASVLPASDAKGREAGVSIGCAIENMRTASLFYGYTPALRILPIPPSEFVPRHSEYGGAHLHIATLTLEKRGRAAVDERMFHAIRARKVSRAEFDQARVIAPEIIERAIAVATDDMVALHVITDGIRRLALAEFQGQADGFVINSPAFSGELGAWLLPNDTDSPTGMPGSNFGLSDAQALRLHKGLLGEAPLEPEDGLRFATAGKIGIEKSPAICVLTVAEDAPSAWISSGMALERLLLLFTSEDIATAIHAGIVEVGLVNRMFAATLGTTRRITALFRAGYLKRPEDGLRPHAPRLPLDRVLL